MKSDNTSNNPFVCVIGGAIIDIVGYPKGKLKMADSTPGNLKFSMGGVGRNIAENLVRLDVNAKLISAIGDDFNGKRIVKHSEKIGLDISNSIFPVDTASSVHLGIMDEKNDMVLGITDIDINELLDITFIKKKVDLINKAKINVIDTNIPKDVIKFLVENCTETKFCLDPISAALSSKVKDLLGHFYILKSNNIEAEELSGIKIKNEKDLNAAAAFFHDNGVEKVIITLGKDGVFYSENNHSEILKPIQIEVINTNGAGDAFTAGVIYAEMNSYPINKACIVGMACSSIAINHIDTVSPEINPVLVERLIL